MTSPERPTVVSFLLLMVGCFGIGFVGAEGTLEGVGGWFLTLERPAWAAPFWLYVPISTVLTGLMTAAAWKVWRSEQPSRTWALTAFWTQLSLLAAWCWLFFAKHLLAVSAIEIGFTLLCALIATGLFFRVKLGAGLLLIPCVIWLAYVGSMNFQIFRLNRPSPTLGSSVSP